MTRNAKLARLIPAAAVALAALAAPATAVPPPSVQRQAPKQPAKTVDVPALRHQWTPADLASACAAAEQQADQQLAKLVAVKDAARTLQGSFVALDKTIADYQETVWRLGFMKDIHQDAAVRDAAAACEERAGKYLVALQARTDLYQAMKGYLQHKGKREKPDPQAARLIEITMRDFKRNGLELSEQDRDKLVALRSRLTELQTKFGKNLNDDQTTFEAKASDLAGLPKDFVAAHAHPKKQGIVVLSTKYPDYYPVMENARSEALRKRMETAFMNRGGQENLALLDEAIILRAQAAQLLGYATHADYVAEDRMAKDAKTIGAFLARMQDGLKEGLAKDREKMRALKAKDTGTKAARINAWDWRYYMNRIKQSEYAIDDAQIRKYFPADRVMSGMFQVYETLFGIAIEEVQGASVWADGVKLYAIKDAQTKRLIAKFYADLHPREGKYGHAAEFTLSSGQQTPQGYRIPMAALVVNFAPPQDGKAAQLSMNEVDTLFHEFGHVMHETLTVARYPSQAGTRTALDFVEAPSQMLENWAYDADVLALISDGMPKDLAARLNAARKYDAGVRYSRQVFLGMFDQAIHTIGAEQQVSADARAKALWAEIMGFPEDDAAHFAGTFGHMMGGYEGGYYGYLWSEVFAADMFTRFQQEGALSKQTGRAYRDLVIARGRMVEPQTLLQDFLGRAPNEAAFLRLTGIQAGPAAGR